MQVEPWGDDRADLRAAVNTSAVVSATAEVKDHDELMRALLGYIKVNSPAENALGPESLARMMRR